MSEELKELLDSTFILRQRLSAVLPPDAVDYLVGLVARDGAHRRMEEICAEVIESVDEVVTE